MRDESMRPRDRKRTRAARALTLQRRRARRDKRATFAVMAASR